ncbi:MAG: sulfotransferase [Gammaproteobacteria bacterium]|jgi:hypothetical protein|nr:sulfotransferase [Gammaproteobacteria bacterium]MDP6615913.1 sulfotransferase [Gammaproteobacteria bacterium]MDP6695048.1 sulfotransferase [Gammaproteobacteria bacterium]MDP7041746.1 sulfotransferase [Gammaproteobacteria bacterium]
MSSNASPEDASIFQVSNSMALFSWLICDHPQFWQKLGRLESGIVADEIDPISVDRPVYVSGLARSGSTILLEILAQVPGVVSHCYKDFPPVYTPYAWHSLLRHMAPGDAKPAERAHKDGILVTQDSPEAMEEPLWMSFFPDAHNPDVSNVITPGCDDAGFAEFYDSTIRKLLAVRGGTRYLAKANYQLTRLEYLLDLYSDAKFVLPVREPAAHIASLVKQHNLFARGQRVNERSRKHLRRMGHFEFGLDRVPINTGDTERTREILGLWERGEEVLGWARYWNQLYSYVADRLDTNDELAAASRIVVFEELCERPDEVLGGLFRHCELEAAPDYLAAAAGRIMAPTYYQSGFDDNELDMIAAETSATMARMKNLATV